MRLIPDRIWGIITVWHEAQSESFKGKVMVAESIINRTKRKHRSDGTVASTVLWPVQYSGWNAHDASPKYRERIEGAKIDTDDPVVKECIRAWDEAEAGSNCARGAMDYYNPRICSPDWAKGATVLAEEGNHRFIIPKEA
jgi:spore germination cell wall hydrolase CwlJ-like protein